MSDQTPQHPAVQTRAATDEWAGLRPETNDEIAEADFEEAPINPRHRHDKGEAAGRGGMMPPMMVGGAGQAGSGGAAGAGARPLGGAPGTGGTAAAGVGPSAGGGSFGGPGALPVAPMGSFGGAGGSFGGPASMPRYGTAGPAGYGAAGGAPPFGGTRAADGSGLPIEGGAAAGTGHAGDGAASGGSVPTPAGTVTGSGGVRNDFEVAPEVLDQTAAQWDTLASELNQITLEMGAAAAQPGEFGLVVQPVPVYNNAHALAVTKTEGRSKDFVRTSQHLVGSSQDYRSTEQSNTTASQQIEV